ncbi:hypothetical protein [Pseudomonas syringae]|uniref:hypothetical protein n=1 Tax=Pseudomonas syringae TaxID=317 RepID=UPI001143F583|nr:hypothetical protein [Pseudomonas syringae]
MRSARQKYYAALKAAGIKKPKPDSSIYINGALETEAFATRIKDFQEKINYRSRIEGADNYNSTTYADQVAALKREKRDQAKYLQNPREQINPLGRNSQSALFTKNTGKYNPR